jgi:NADPH:quinone reductase-like Zn-dependent oxidoreductase
MSAGEQSVAAAVIEAMGEPPVPGRTARPRIDDGLVAVAVAYSTLNPVEIRLARGEMGGPPDVPYVPGVEGVGTVLDGPHAGSPVRFECALPGHGKNGALAEVAAAEPDSIHPLPDGVEPALAAAIGLVGVTADLALDAGEPLEGARVAVLGASGSVGRMAVQLARLRGAARIAAAGRDREQLERVRELGADEIVVLGEDDDVQSLAESLREAAGGPLDVVVDPLWGVPGAAAVTALADGGRAVNVGQAAGADQPPPLGPLRNRRAALIGMSSGWTDMARKRESYGRVLEAAREGRVHLDYEVVALARVADAWNRHEGSPHTKFVIEIGGGS